MFLPQAIVIFVFTFSGILLFYTGRRSIVIRNRLPKLVYFEAVSTAIAGLFASLDSYGENKVVPCWVLYGIYGPVSLISITLIVCRISYVYGYLTKTDSSFQIRRLFWENNVLQIKRVLIFIIVLVLGTWANSFGYYISSNYWSPPLDSLSCPDVSLYFCEVIYFAFTLCQFYFAGMIVYRQAFDKIGMSYELVGYGISIFVINVILFVHFGTLTGTTIYICCITNNFFSLYFPCIVILRHNNKLGFKRISSLKKKKTLTSSSMLLDDKVQLLCKRFLCEENGAFIIKYKEYKNGKIGFGIIRELFFVPNALYELNISHELRTSVLTSDNDETRQKSLEIIHQEVVQMVKDNILPYLDKEEV